MRKEKATAHYLGKEGHKKLNCAQAIINAFKDKFSLDEETVHLFEGYGKGNAPGGLCGAYYAAKYILGKNDKKIKECEAVFLASAGSLKCSEVRSQRKATCIDCVEKMADFIDGI